VEHVTPFNPALRDPAISHIWDMATVADRAALNAEVTRQATIVAYSNDFRLMMIIALASVPFIFLLRRAQSKAEQAAVLE